MAISKYTKQETPNAGLQLFVDGEFRRIQLTTDGIIFLLKALEVPIEIGAPNSGGAGFRMLRIPN